MTNPIDARNTGKLPTGSIGAAVISAAKKQLGVTYAWGGGDKSGPTMGIRDGGVADSFGDYMKVGFDCSGLTQYAWGQVGVDIPGDSTSQHAAVPRVDSPQMGDIMWWPGHVALYIDGNSMIQAPQSGKVVEIAPLRKGAVYHRPNGGDASLVSVDGDGNIATPDGGITTVGSVTGVSAKAWVVIGGVAVVGFVIIFSQVGKG